MNKGVTTLKNHFVTFTKYSQLSDNIKYIKIELKAKKEPKIIIVYFVTELISLFKIEINLKLN